MGLTDVLLRYPKMSSLPVGVNTVIADGDSFGHGPFRVLQYLPLHNLISQLSKVYFPMLLSSPFKKPPRAKHAALLPGGRKENREKFNSRR